MEHIVSVASTLSKPATVDWCESNHAVVPFIAEFWNTMSSFVLAFAGIYGYHKHKKLQGNIVFCILAIVGIGSIFFHGALTVFTQMLDEIPMIFLVMQLLVNTLAINSYIYVIYGYAIFHSIMIFVSSFYKIQSHELEFYLFQATIIFSAIAIFFTMLRLQASSVTKRLFTRGISYFLLGWSCWLADFFLCDFLKSWCWMNPQFHAWWHVFSAIGVYHISLISIISRHSYNQHSFIINKSNIYPVIKIVSHDERHYL